jgi:MFS family permease
MRLPTPAFLRDNAPWLAAGALLTFSSSYGQTYFIAIFAGNIQAEFGLSHGDWGAIYGAGTLGSAFLMLWAGVLTDHFRVRVLGAVTLALLGLACLAMAAVPAGWALVPVILMLRLAGQGMASHTATVAMARWFVSTRGKALAVATLGFAVGEAVLPLVFVSALDTVPWRTLWVAAAGLAVLAIPVLMLLLRRERTPQSTAGDNQAPGLMHRHWTRAEVLRHPLFWSVVPLILGPAAFSTALFFQQVHLSEVKGWSHVSFVALFPLYTVAAVTGMVLSGLAIDRFGAGRLLPYYQMPLTLGFVVLGLSPGLGGAALGMALIALGTGGHSTLPAAFWAEYFGTRHLGAIRAAATSLMVLGTAVGPVLTGALIDGGVNFDRQLPVLALWFVGASVLAGLAIRQAAPALPARV